MIFNKAKIILVMLFSVFYLSMKNAVVWLYVKGDSIFCSENAPIQGLVRDGYQKIKSSYLSK